MARVTSKLPSALRIEQEVTKNVMVSQEKSELNIKETGPMSRIEELDISGVDTKSVNVCYLLSQLPRLKV